MARQTGQIVGNVLILYDFTMPGEIPSIMNIAHGNDALRDMQQMDLSMELPVADADNPVGLCNNAESAEVCKMLGNSFIMTCSIVVRVRLQSRLIIELFSLAELPNQFTSFLWGKCLIANHAPI